MITTITSTEPTVGPLVATDDVRAARQAHLQQAVADFEVAAVTHPDQ